MNYKDGFLLLHSELSRQLAFAPDVPDDLTANDWFCAYSGKVSHQAIKDSVEADAQEMFEDFPEDYDSLDDVPRDEVVRARIYEDGSAHIFICDESHGDAADISDEEDPVIILTRNRIYQAFGIKDPIPEVNVDPGEYLCEIKIRIFDEAALKESLGLDGGAALSGADMAQVFGCAESGDIGASLIDIGLQEIEQGLNVTLVARVDNPDQFNICAARVGRGAGRDADFIPSGMGDAIFEMWFGGNDAGSPVDSGYEVMDYSKDTVSHVASNDTPEP